MFLSACGTTASEPARTAPPAEAAEPTNPTATSPAAADPAGSGNPGDTKVTAPAPDPMRAAIVANVAKDMRAYDIPGAQIAVVQNGKLAWAESLGVKKHGETDAVTNATRFRVASLSKMILGATALSMVERGTLDLSRPVTDYAPGYTLAAGFDAKSIHLEHLLTHTAGMPDMTVSFETCAASTRLADYFANVDAPQPLWSPPGAVWNYSNRGFAVAGLVLEMAAGKRYEELATERVLAPSGMTRATFDMAAAMADDHAVGWAADPGNGRLTNLEPDAFDCTSSHPPAGILATATDYAHFVEMLFGTDDKALTRSSVTTLLTGHARTNQTPNAMYSYGLDIDDYKGLRLAHHNGIWNAGYLTSIWMVPEAKFAIVVFYNGLGRSPDLASRFAVDTYFDKTRVASPTYATPSSTWGKYAGKYEDPYHFGTITIAFAAGKLTCDIPAQHVVAAKMTQLAGDEFSAPGVGAVTFYPDAEGAPHWFVTRSGVGTKSP